MVANLKSKDRRNDKDSIIADSYALILTFSLVLNGYSSGISGLTLGSLLYTIGSIYIFTIKLVANRSKYLIAIDYSPIRFYSILTISSLLGLLFLDTAAVSLSGIFSIQMKIAVWTITTSVFATNLSEYGITIKSIYKLAIISTTYLILQYLAWEIFGMYLPNIVSLGVLQPYHPDYINYAAMISSSTALFRPSAFYSEPAFYSSIALIGLSAVVFGEINTKYQTFIALFISLGIVLSTSTAGTVLLSIVIVAWLFRKMKLNTFAVYLSVALIILVLLNNMLISDNFLRFIGDSSYFIRYTVSKISNYQSSMRIGKSYQYLSSLIGISKVFGIGLGNESTFLETSNLYMNSLTNVIMGSGLIGLIALFGLMIRYLLRTRTHLGIVLLTILAIKIGTSGILFNLYGITYFTVIINSTMKKQDGQH